MAPTVFIESARYKSLDSIKKNSVDLYLCYCGMQACDSGHYYGPHTRNDYLIHVVLSGKGTYNVGGKDYFLGPTSFFLINPGEETYYQADSDDPWTYVWIGFNGLKAEAAIRHAGLINGRVIGTVANIAPYRDAVYSMLEARQLTFQNDLKRESRLYEFIAALIDENADAAGERKAHDYSYQIYVEHAIEYIEHNYDRNIKVYDIAEYIGINRSYLTKCFTDVMSTSPQQYLLSYRMIKADSLLASTDMTVNEAARSVGYDDALTFSKAFKRFFGVSPRERRNAAERVVTTAPTAEELHRVHPDGERPMKRPED